MKKKLTNKGISIIEMVVVLLVVAVLGLGGWYIWQKSHKTKPIITGSNNGTTQTAPQPKPGVDPFVGWKTYSDNLYKYSFKYPTDWVLQISRVATQPCDVGQLTVTSPGGSVVMSYTNANNHDQAIFSLTTFSLDVLTTANQDLTVVGGYTSYDTGYLPIYNLTDSALLTTYPVIIGQTSNFPTVASITDQGTTSKCTGSFISQPSQQSDTIVDAKSWFTTSDAKISLKILKSFSYNK